MKDAIERIGGLSKPGKMPCPSWSIPAKDCITGRKLAERADSVCAGCYAMKGFYHMPVVRDAQQRRFDILQGALTDATKRAQFIADFVTVIKGKKLAYFRWHDSGDIQSAEHLAMLVEIANLCPNTSFWLPTKEYSIVKEYISRATFPANLTVRVSYAFINQFGSPNPVWPCTSAVAGADIETPPHVKTCPVGVDKGRKTCQDCRTCWDASVVTVAYKLH